MRYYTQEHLEFEPRSPKSIWSHFAGAISEARASTALPWNKIVPKGKPRDSREMSIHRTDVFPEELEYKGPVTADVLCTEGSFYVARFGSEGVMVLTDRSYLPERTFQTHHNPLVGSVVLRSLFLSRGHSVEMRGFLQDSLNADKKFGRQLDLITGDLVDSESAERLRHPLMPEPIDLNGNAPIGSSYKGEINLLESMSGAQLIIAFEMAAVKFSKWYEEVMAKNTGHSLEVKRRMNAQGEALPVARFSNGEIAMRHNSQDEDDYIRQTGDIKNIYLSIAKGDSSSARVKLEALRQHMSRYMIDYLTAACYGLDLPS